ncbi:Uncharacterised protein [Chlamydia abortus]|nr:Uncharacterised protein [Chlamydia abortus]
MPIVTVIAEIPDLEEIVRYEYEGVLIGDSHALYVDRPHNFVVLEKVRFEDEVYKTTGGPGSVVLDLEVADTSFIERLGDMSAVEFLNILINGGNHNGK